MLLPTLERLTPSLDEVVPPSQHPTARALAREMLERATPAFLAEFSAPALAALVSDALALLAQRKAGSVTVRAGASSHPDIPYTVVVVHMDDRPFIVSSVRAAVRRLGFEALHVLHPILPVVRNPEGRLLQVGGDAPHRLEVYELFLLAPVDDPVRLAALESEIRRVLEDIIRVTDDHAAMCRALQAAESRLVLSANGDAASPAREASRFLSWLGGRNFIFLGSGTLRRGPASSSRSLVAGTGLGLMRPGGSLLASLDASAAVPPSCLRVTRLALVSPVARAARIACIEIDLPLPDWGGTETMVFAGLFTSQARTASPREIPILDRKLTEVLHLDGALEGSHDQFRIEGTFASMPREDLLEASSSHLLATIRAIMEADEQRSLRLVLHPVHDGFAAWIVAPRERLVETVRNRIQEHVRARLAARSVQSTLVTTDDAASHEHLHLLVHTNLPLSSIDVAQLEREIAGIARTWDDGFEEGLVETAGENRGRALATEYRGLLPEDYRSATCPDTAVRDVLFLDGLEPGGLRVDLVSQAVNQPHALSLYHRRPDITLGDTLPVLENLGLRVLGQNVYELLDPGARIDVFRVQPSPHATLETPQVRERLLETVTAVFAGQVDNDALNTLVLTAGLTARQVMLLRTYCHYHAQLEGPAAGRLLQDALLTAPVSARSLFEFFSARFSPAPREGDSTEEACRDRFIASLAQVSSLAHDGALRTLLDLMQATVRTNFFANRPCVSFKVSSRAVRTMPEPRPLFEIFVSSPEVEGIHLRGGRIARGGVRWSDRPHDFRTEILGLMKTQMTKNTLIVPVGSKGGFVLRRPPQAREELVAHARQQYCAFIGALLDVTDNMEGQQVVTPPHVVAHDGPDPYLVVAADKGTATFSDLANSVAHERHFWLGDAFASGGSHGYDHKKEGITARGAWESVRQHFRELGLDMEQAPFTVAGIGDMSGDVFGNGMLYSRSIRLLAAFDHRHVFLDPDPDALRSHAERSRLFAQPRSSWGDYDRAAISPGGGVHPRQAKAIPLSAQVRRMLDLDQEEASGEEVVRAILRMPVDLLWNGGIGTYVKAAAERNTDVGDATNDAVRVDATDLRARVVGEGGNQGFTQRARIEYARRGGRICTDAVDNSAGVDLSDHEVNLKILLQPLVDQGTMDAAGRDLILEELKPAVIELVLQDNRRQTVALSLEEARSRRALSPFVSHLARLVEGGRLKPEVEFLPSPRKLAERIPCGEGLSRPELAVLLAYTKMDLYEAILASNLPDDPALSHVLHSYFPAAVTQRLGDAVDRHALRREIIATQICNRVADMLGMAFVDRIHEHTAAPPEEILQALLAAWISLDLDSLLPSLFLDPTRLSLGAQADAIERVRSVMDEVVTMLVQRQACARTPVKAGITTLVEHYRETLRELRGVLDTLLFQAEAARHRQLLAEAHGSGLPESLAAPLASLEYAPALYGIADVAAAAGVDPTAAARAFQEVGTRLSLRWLRDRLATQGSGERWERVMLSTARSDLQVAQVQIAAAVARTGKAGLAPLEHACPSLLSRYDQLLRDAGGDGLTAACGVLLVRLVTHMSLRMP